MTAQPSSQAEREDVALLPCPFCGGEATVRTYQTESLWSHNTVTYTQVGCEECDYQRATEPGYDPEAIVWWNARPDREHATPRSMPEEVVEAYDAAGFGARVLAVMSGRTCREVAPEIGISPATLNRVTRGKTPDLPTYFALRRWLLIPGASA